MDFRERKRRQEADRKLKNEQVVSGWGLKGKKTKRSAAPARRPSTSRSELIDRMVTQLAKLGQPISRDWAHQTRVSWGLTALETELLLSRLAAAGVEVV
jgi:hypothetical protein